MGLSGSTLVIRVSKPTALLASLGFSLIFVGSLYFWKLLGYPDYNRDAKSTIQRRAISALVSCGLSAALVRLLAEESVGPESLSFAELLGVTTSIVWPSFYCLALTAGLFIGPIVQHLAMVAEGVVPLMSPPPGGVWVSLRNLLYAPCTEEFVFRACMVRLWVAAAFPTGAIVFLTPFCFALAHTHHFLEQVRRCGNKKVALMNIGFQVFYTSLFGMYSNFLLVRTGSLPAVMLAHSFCNHQGFPDVGFLQSPRHPLYRHRQWIGAVYLTGIIGFATSLGPMTAGFDSTFTHSIVAA